MEPHEYARMFSLEEGHWWYRALRRNIRQALTRAGALPSADARPACLDAGCGTGMLLAALGDRVQAVGLDFSRAALSGAARRRLTRLVQASVEAIPLRSETMEIVLSADVLYHRGVRDDVAALRELHRCLKPGGILVLNLPAFTWLRSTHDEAIHTARRYTAREVREKLRQAGLRPLQVRYWNFLLFLPLALVRLGRRWTHRPLADGAAPNGARAQVPESDLRPVPAWLNATLNGVLALEARLSFLPPPVGLSILTVARKE